MKLNNIFLYAILFISFFSYERNLYYGFYQISTFLILFFQLLLFIFNSKENIEIFTKELKRNMMISILSVVLVFSTLVVSFGESTVELFEFFIILANISSLYIGFLIIPVFLYEKKEFFLKKIFIIISITSIIAIIIGVFGSFMGYSNTHYNRTASIFFDPNYYAIIASIGFFLGINLKDKNKLLAYTNLFGIYFSGSRTAVLAIIIVLILTNISLIFKKISIKKIIVLLLLLSGISVGLNFLNENGYFRTYQGLSERDELWEISFELIEKKPLVGYGYGNIDEQFKKAGAVNSSSHNAYLDYTLTYGIPACVINAVIIILGLIRAIQKRIPKSIIQVILFLLISANSISINLGGVGFLSLMLTICLGLGNNNNFKGGKYENIISKN